MNPNELHIAVIPGDGIGIEVTNEAIRVGKVLNDYFNTSIAFHMFPYGASHYLETTEIIPDEIFTEWPLKFSAIFIGALGDPRIKDNAHADGILLALRFRLDLYVNMRPVSLTHTDLCPLKHITKSSDIDLVIFRENTEDLYAQMGAPFRKGLPGELAVEISMNTKNGAERIIRAAFEYALRHGYNNVTMGDKSNVLKHAGRIWQEAYEKVGGDYPQITKNHMYVDNLAMQLVRDPAQFGVIVTSNMFGDILSDLASELQGGIGLSPSANYNPDLAPFLGLYEPVHGSAPQIAGKNLANPIAAIRSLALLIRNAGHDDAFRAVEDAVKAAIENKKIVPELKGNSSTVDTGNFICEYIARNN